MASECFQDLRIFDACVTEQELGRGSYASVHSVKWRGLTCAGKRVHRVLLENAVSGTANRVVEGFVRECQTWSTLRHPNIAQFLGVHYEPDCSVPVIVMEKMDVSLRGVLDKRSRQRFPLRHKVNILYQVALGLLYLHCHSSQLVHRDLTANNILLNLTSMTAKISDFGVAKCMAEANVIEGKSLTEVPGVVAYMPPEAFQSPPVYAAPLDVFSYGVLVIHTVVHVWPDPLHATRCEVGQLVALTELQRRETHIAMFSESEQEFLLPIVEACLQNDPRSRPLTATIVNHFESVLGKFAEGLSPPSLFEIEDQWSSRDEQLRTALERIQQLENLYQQTVNLSSEELGSLALRAQRLAQQQQLAQQLQLLHQQQSPRQQQPPQRRFVLLQHQDQVKVRQLQTVPVQVQQQQLLPNPDEAVQRAMMLLRATPRVGTGAQSVQDGSPVRGIVGVKRSPQVFQSNGNSHNDDDDDDDTHLHSSPKMTQQQMNVKKGDSGL